MKKITFYILALLSFSLNAQTPFTRGVNLTGWFQVSGPKQIQFTKYTIRDFQNIKSLGCDVIRLPINLHSMTKGAPNYELDETFLFFLDRAVDMAEETGIHLLLDNHTFDPASNTEENIGTVLIPVWKNMAEHFKNRSKLVYYEILNEPHGIDDAKWNSIQQQVIDAIRTIDTVHTIVVGPAGWNSYNNLKYMPVYQDTNLIYTFHFYDPFLFTHQGASWTDPSMVDLKDMPFPYSQSKMPPFPSSLNNTWIYNEYNNYKNSGTILNVYRLIDIAVNFMNERNIKIFCGEFGVYIPNSPDIDRTFWYSIVRNYLEQKGIAWTIWDYHGGFGVFNEGSDGMFEHDVNTNLVKALGLNALPQTVYQMKPDSTGFRLYDDYFGPQISASGSNSSGTLDSYSEDNPSSGKYCIYWSGVDQYSNIGFDFVPNKDMSELVKNNYAIRFKIKGDTPGARFDIRFIDTKTSDPNDHPWRMRYTVNSLTAPFDNQWHEVVIPLKIFTEHGSWDNAWYNPEGKYDWKAVDRFEIVAEHFALSNIQFWFDDIEIINPLTSAENTEAMPDEYRLFQNYPNPFNPISNIKYEIAKSGNVNLVVYDILGREVAVLVNKEQSPGYYQVVFDGSTLSSGLYIYRLKAGNFVSVKKMILTK